MRRMSTTRAQISISLDGFVAGPDQSTEHPLGVGGERLHEWAFPTAGFARVQGREGGEENADSAVIDEIWSNIGAFIMGRNMFGPIRGEWDESWAGWRRGGGGGGARGGGGGGGAPRRPPRGFASPPPPPGSRCRWRAARRSTSSR